MTLDDYTKIEAVNWSTIVHLATSAKLLEWRAENPREETKALRLGTLIHCAVLEPERWATYIPEPDFGDLRTKAAKAARAEWHANIGPGVDPIDADDHVLATRCADAARSHPAVRDLLRGGRAEEVITWTDETTGLACKGRADYLAPAYLVDVKSTRAETLSQFGREFASRLYHGQLAFYLDGCVASRRLDPLSSQVFAIGIQTSEPFDVIPARLRVEDIERGRGLYRSLLRRYAECRAASWWPGLAPGVVDLHLPEWAASGGGHEEQTGDEW